MPSRRRARERALQMLFQWEISKDAPKKVQELYWGNRGRGIALPPEVAPEETEDESLRYFSNGLFAGTVAAADAIDSIIRKHAENWRLERMPAVDRNILRLGIYEILNCRETPAAVVINEALEIARKYSEEESVSFINGLLDRVRKEAETAHPA